MQRAYLGVRLDPEFDAETAVVNGTAGCNRYRAGYETAGSALSFRPGPGTMMACPEPGVSEQEQAFHTALAAVSGFEELEGGLRASLAVCIFSVANFVKSSGNPFDWIVSG